MVTFWCWYYLVLIVFGVVGRTHSQEVRGVAVWSVRSFALWFPASVRRRDTAGRVVTRLRGGGSPSPSRLSHLVRWGATDSHGKRD